MVRDETDNVRPVCGVGALCAECGAVCIAGACLQAVYTGGGEQQTGGVWCIHAHMGTIVCVHGVVYTAGGMHLMGCVYSKGGAQQTA